MRAHKITLQALWRLLVPLLLKFCKTINVDLALQISRLLSSEQNVNDLITCLKSPQFQTVYDEFLTQKCQENVNFQFWWNYTDGDDIYPTRFYPCAAGGRLGVVSRQLPCHASILFQVRPPELCQVGIGIYRRDGTIAV